MYGYEMNDYINKAIFGKECEHNDDLNFLTQQEVLAQCRKEFKLYIDPTYFLFNLVKHLMKKKLVTTKELVNILQDS